MNQILVEEVDDSGEMGKKASVYRNQGSDVIWDDVLWSLVQHSIAILPLF